MIKPVGDKKINISQKENSVMSALWPNSCPASLKDDDLEREVSSMLLDMSLKQKIGQMIQPDIKNAPPEEAARYHIGSVLSGGGGYPHGHAQASAASWVALADEY